MRTSAAWKSQDLAKALELGFGGLGVWGFELAKPDGLGFRV